MRAAWLNASQPGWGWAGLAPAHRRAQRRAKSKRLRQSRARPNPELTSARFGAGGWRNWSGTAARFTQQPPKSHWQQEGKMCPWCPAQGAPPSHGPPWGALGGVGTLATARHESTHLRSTKTCLRMLKLVIFFLKKSKDTADTIVIFPLNSGWCCSGLLLNSYSAECSLVVLPFISICLKKISFVKVSFKMSIASSRCLEQQLFQVHI